MVTLGRDRRRRCPRSASAARAAPTMPSRCRRSPPSGQSRLMRVYDDVARPPTASSPAQVLLAPLDFVDRRQYLHARRTLHAAARAGRACRSSTRTTPSPTTRSASATTTASPRSSPTSSAPTCSCCSPTRPGCSPPIPGSTPTRLAHRGDRRGRPRARGSWPAAPASARGSGGHGVEAGGGQDRRRGRACGR